MTMDLSLYLVTDSTPAILKGRDICQVVEEALKGGWSLQAVSMDHRLMLGMQV